MAHGDAREGKWWGNWRMEWVSSTLHTTSEHGVSSITTADAHTSPASSRLNWRPRWFKWTRPFRRKTKSGFCACHHILTGLYPASSAHAPYCHLWPVRLYNIIPRILTNDTRFSGGGEDMEHKMFWFLYNFGLKHCICFSFFGAFAKLRKATINFVMPVCSHGTTRLPHWTDFHKIWYPNIFRQSV